MNFNICLLLIGIILLDAITSTESQDCSNYVLIADGRRTTQRVYDGQTDVPISDKDIDPSKWYRFQSYSGDMIPERAEGDGVEFNRCGTSYPIYISGLDQHPTHDHETKTATVKIPDWQREISIHKCPPQEDGESFYNYLLVPAPADQAAYCAGEGEPCPDGLMFNGIECVDYFPILKGPPIFSGPHTTGNNAEMQVYFKCQVQYDRVPDDNAARFMITFIFDGLELESIETPHKQLPPFIVGPDGDLSANLTEYYLQGRLGKEIQCKVRSFWLEDGEKGTAMISVDKYKATLEAVEIFDFDLNNGAVQRIPFPPTLPFTYFHCAASGCPLPFAYFFVLNTDVATNFDCSLVWNGPTPELTVNITPFAGSRTFEVKFKPYAGDFIQHYSSLWHNFIIPTVMIRAFHSSEKLCRSISGGHIATLDGLDFNSFVAGDYNLVLGEAAQYRLEVQVRQESCNGNVACNCGVIVREVNSAVKVGYNECGEWDSTTARQISVTRLLAQQPDDGTEINNDDIGRKFSIRMPSGTRVEVDATVPWFNVAVHLAPIYHGKTSVNSLCGNSNGNPNDDTNDASISRIVDPAKSYFNVQPDCYAEFLPPAISCFCSDSQTVECTDTEENIIPKSPANTDLSTIWSSGVICIAPGSSFLHKHSREKNLLLSWPTPKGKTESEAAKYCSDILAGSSVFNDCGTVVKTDLIILQCVKDIQIADEYIATTSYASSFVQECLNILIAQENNSTGGSASPAFDISAIYNQICPAQCSGHGTCTNATCICNGVIETLQPCSRTCDYGAQIKETVCSINNAVIKTEPVLCQTTSCTAIPEENLQGVILTLSNKNTMKLLLTPTDILSHIAQIISSYCFAHATQCCDSVGIPNGVSLSSFASLESCTYGSGYPQVGDTTSRIKVIVKIIRSEVQSKCLQVAVDSSIVTVGEQEYADPNIIVDAVTEGKEVIERALNITIESVEK